MYVNKGLRGGGEAPNLKTILNFILFEKDKRVDNGKKAEVIHTHIYIHIYMYIHIHYVKSEPFFFHLLGQVRWKMTF